VLLYSKLGTLNFDSLSNEESKSKIESDHGSVVFENVKSIRLSEDSEEKKEE